MATRKSKLALERMQQAKQFVMKAAVYKAETHVVNNTTCTYHKEQNKVAKININQWIIEEKFDGVRARWHDGQFMSCSKKVFPVHPQIIAMAQDAFGDMEIDGEFTCGRGLFQQSVSIVRNSHSSLAQWLRLSYQIFDIVDLIRPYTQRRRLLDKLELSYIKFQLAPKLGVVNSPADIIEHFNTIRALDGEGIMLRNPESPYVYKRTPNLLKVKNRTSAEATVVGYTEGDGKHVGKIGALICTDGLITFRIGTGLSDEVRDNPPAIGSTITYEFMEYTLQGNPRHATYIGVRDYE